MPKAKKTNGVGHNSGDEITIDDRAALQHHFAIKIRKQRFIVAERRADLDIERDELNGLFSSARGELGLTRKEFEEVLALQDMTEAQFRNHEGDRLNRMRLAGLPVGTQLELFPQGDTVDDKIDAEADGFRAGRRGDDPIPPSLVSPMLRPDWMAGWHRGQAANGELLGRAAEILAAKDAKKPEMSADEPAGEDREGDGDVEPWSEPSPAEAEFATA